MSVRIDRVALIAEMARRNMTCNRLVELSRVSRATITAARSGKTVSKATADKLAAVLGQDIIEKDQLSKVKRSSEKANMEKGEQKSRRPRPPEGGIELRLIHLVWLVLVVKAD